ncbi:hypothetical protein Moror_9581 [Moniliophthora roreri MCA 2997]|uniref:Uncharacterized protein n=2 Tax=Moniliophthora roreri TaxID=221103 RepID=V2XBI6_MONRO|nr:hypothetical protein Moror_9581 [Moniliophthora roreri MCA 2997]
MAGYAALTDEALGAHIDLTKAEFFRRIGVRDARIEELEERVEVEENAVGNLGARIDKLEADLTSKDRTIQQRDADIATLKMENERLRVFEQVVKENIALLRRNDLLSSEQTSDTPMEIQDEGFVEPSASNPSPSPLPTVTHILKSVEYIGTPPPRANNTPAEVLPLTPSPSPANRLGKRARSVIIALPESSSTSESVTGSGSSLEYDSGSESDAPSSKRRRISEAPAPSSPRVGPSRQPGRVQQQMHNFDSLSSIATTSTQAAHDNGKIFVFQDELSASST